MDGLKIPVALVFAMAVQLVALVWYISNLVHDIEHLQIKVSEQQQKIELLDLDIDDLWTFCTFTENKWAEAYVDDMVYERVCGTKEVAE
jgi:cell division protein FtsB|tara:strand:+ start:7 stop:273 length:267 start_codon:yes stop_codon:yes gene_type:complete